jgi:hypothetical protein
MRFRQLGTEDIFKKIPFSENLETVKFLRYWGGGDSLHKYWYSNCVRWGTLLVAQLVEALRYKPEGRWFNSRWCH